MKQVVWSLVLLLGAATAAQNIPPELHGKWVIQEELHTSTISCWGEEEAKRIIGTEIEYTANSFRWDHIVTTSPKINVALVTAERFRSENSGQGANSSQVSFRQLGIKTAKAKQVSITHAPADITGATTEIPGDTVLLKDRNTIVFAVCNVYFEARRLSATTHH